MDTMDVVVIGAGVVGLAVARAFAIHGRETLILEARKQFGTGTSSRNSEVIHAGIYYPRGSLKARLCVSGRDQLYYFCESNGVGYRRCGKLIVATADSQRRELERIRSAALANGVTLSLLTREAAMQLEPQLSCVAALHSPLTGIVDSHAYMLALLGHAQGHGASLVCESSVTSLERTADGILVGINREDPALLARVVINSAGLHASQVAGLIDTPDVPSTHFVKGNYFNIAGRSPFQRLVYPIPEQGGLGVHLTIDVAGRARFGPDVQWGHECGPNSWDLDGRRGPDGRGFAEGDYDVDPRRAAGFYAAIREYWPALPDGALVPAYAGFRPRISGPGEPLADFRIDGPQVHGVPGLVNLLGIESPGLTSSLAIADYVVNLV
jgi:L-2-hydroxyglutarate oxidase LhgO